MWPGELIVLLLVLYGCADYIYFQQILTKQTQKLNPSGDSTTCQTVSCKARRQIEEGVVTETENNYTISLNMEVVEQINRTIEGKPDDVYLGKEEQLKRKQDLLDRIIQSTTTISNVNYTSPDNTATSTLNFVDKLLSEASKKIKTYSTANHQDSEGDLGNKSVQKEIKEIVPTVNQGEILTRLTQIIVEERKLLTLPDETTRNSEIDVPTEITEADRELSQTIAAITGTSKEESKHQRENNELSFTENLPIFGAGKSDKPMNVDKIVLATENKNSDSTLKDGLNLSFSYKDFTISKDVVNTTDNTLGTPLSTKETEVSLPHSTELYLNKQTTNDMDKADTTLDDITESNYLNVKKTAKTTNTVGKSNLKTNLIETSAKLTIVNTGKIFSTSPATTAPSKLNYVTNNLETTRNRGGESKKAEQVNQFVKNEDITKLGTFSLKQNSIEHNLLNVSTPPVGTQKTIDSLNNTITETPHKTHTETNTHELRRDVSKTTSTSSVTKTSDVNQSSTTAVSDIVVSEEENENSTRNEISQNSASLGTKNSDKNTDITSKTNENDLTASKTVTFTNTVGM